MIKMMLIIADSPRIPPRTAGVTTDMHKISEGSEKSYNTIKITEVGISIIITQFRSGDSSLCILMYYGYAFLISYN